MTEKEKMPAGNPARVIKEIKKDLVQFG